MERREGRVRIARRLSNPYPTPPPCPSKITPVQVATRFDCYVMTAGTREYAEPLLDELDPYGLLKGRFYRDDCIFHEGHFLKDLTLVDSNPKRVVLVDNNPASFVLCPANGIPVPSFYDDPRGEERGTGCSFKSSFSLSFRCFTPPLSLTHTILTINA